MPEHWCSREIARHDSLSLPLRLRRLSLVVLQQTAQPLPTPHRCLSISCSFPLQRKQNQILFALVVALLLPLANEFRLLRLAAGRLRQQRREKSGKEQKSSGKHGDGRSHARDYLTTPLA